MERLTAGFVLRERYQLARRLASGGMGAVWQASDLLLDRPVAIKIMHPHTAAERELASRFHDEAQYSAKLNSPHTVGVYDYGEDNGLAFLVMELVPGQTVAQLIRDRGALDPEFVRSTIAQVASGLDTAHRWGIVHRDVKPSNIMVTPEGEAKLGVFGIARAVDGSSRTRTGEIFGTPQYLSPEQAQGLPTSPASDLYSLGVVAHEMLTGVRPFERTTPLATALAHVNEPPPPLPDAIPAPLADAIVACLQKDPADRPESPPRGGDPQAHRRGKQRQGDRRHAGAESQDRRAPPREPAGEARHEGPVGAHPLRHPHWPDRALTPGPPLPRCLSASPS